MKTIEEILNNYSQYETQLDDRFGRRFCNFLTKEQMSTIGFKTSDTRHKPTAWTLENILAQLKEDAEFGLEKAEGERGISSSLMYEVCESWCKIINKEDLILEYDDYGIETFKKILNFIKESHNA